MTVFVLARAAAAALVLSAPVARAHALESSLETVPGHVHTLLLQSQFSSGEPAADAAVALVAPGQPAIAVGRTDAAGQLRFARPAATLEAGSAAWELRVDQGAGHRDYLELPAVAAAAAPFPAAPQAKTLPLSLFGWTGSSLLLVGALARRSIRQGR